MRFNRIFWKIFTAIWLVNILVVVGVVWLLGSGHLRERMQHKQTSQVERLAEQLISQYERGEQISHRRSKHVKKMYRRLKIDPGLQLHITSANGVAIYNGYKRFNQHQRRDSLQPSFMLELQLESASGQYYDVYYPPIRPPRFVATALRDMVGVQLFLMFAASAVLSALISWGITQPLKRLQMFSRSYRPGTASQRLDAKTLDKRLLQRGDELGDLARDIARMTAQVDAAFNAQEDLLHDVSHELRAPLARMQVGVALAELAAPNHPAMAKMHAQCEHMNALIQRILEYSRLQSASVSTNIKTMAPINLQTLLVQVADDITFEFSDRAVSVACDDPQASIVGDKHLLQSAVENLMRNACKHTAPGTAVELRLTARHITVRDYGLGVNEDPNKLLKPFYRAGGKMHTEGFGLGLSIVARAVENLGATLTLANHPEGGFIATIGLPDAVV